MCRVYFLDSSNEEKLKYYCELFGVANINFTKEYSILPSANNFVIDKVNIYYAGYDFLHKVACVVTKNKKIQTILELDDTTFFHSIPDEGIDEF